ncbi:MAG: tyrosine-type recombinase/integrase [Acidimicrobiaceae bacterium]|nr:tyrosine-type recombinase/integrase [Acidimicrobiaceae bacterium]
MRDAAVVAVMSDAMLRVGEASALDAGDIVRADDGTGRVMVARSKTDPEGEGAALYLRASTVARVDAWLAAAKHHDGPLFRPVTRGGRAQSSRLSPRSVGAVVASAAAAIGVVGASGHSLRIGAAQSLVRNGAELPDAMLAGRWKSPTMPVRYARSELACRGAVARRRPEADLD